MTKTSKENLVRSASARQSRKPVHSQKGPESVRGGLKYGRSCRDQRVTLRPMELRVLNQLRQLVNEAVTARLADGISNSRSTQLVVEMLREPRASKKGAHRGVRLLKMAGNGRGLAVRLTPHDGRVYLQELETAGKRMRPVPASEWMLFPDEVAPIARALAGVAGLTIAEATETDTGDGLHGLPNASDDEKQRRVEDDLVAYWNQLCDNDAEQQAQQRASEGNADA